MQFSKSFILAIQIAVTFVSARSVPELTKRDAVLDAWLVKEKPVAYGGILANIGPNGANAQGVNAGAIIASPSKSNPDYWYQWTRDSAMTFKVLLNDYLKGNATLESYLRDYVNESQKLQHTENPSGNYYTGGIGEPKFYVDGRPYTGGWGRPQNDGPAIRATVLIAFANKLLEKGETTYVKTRLYDGKLPTDSVIKADLEHVANNWQKNNFDLWEEVNAIHFFTFMVQRRALIEGAELADKLGDTGAASWYRTQANAIAAKLPSFWNGAYINEHQGINYRSGVDCATLLGAIHGNGAKGYGLYEPVSDEIILSLEKLVSVMKPLYGINSNTAVGTAIGRYPEDVYDGVGTSKAHPWFICTATAADILFQARNKLIKNGKVDITSLNVNFYKKWVSSAAVGNSFTAGSSQFLAITGGLTTYADGFLARVKLHATSEGDLSEQFNRDTGFQEGAKKLTWSYAALVAAINSRDGAVPY